MMKKPIEDVVKVLGRLLRGDTKYRIVEIDRAYDKRFVTRVEREYRQRLNKLTITETRYLSEWVALHQSHVALFGDQELPLCIPVPPDSPAGEDIQAMNCLAEFDMVFRGLARKFGGLIKANPELASMGYLERAQKIADLMRKQNGPGG
jgi:hypothetical protein